MQNSRWSFRRFNTILISVATVVAIGAGIVQILTYLESRGQPVPVLEGPRVLMAQDAVDQVNLP